MEDIQTLKEKVSALVEKIRALKEENENLVSQLAEAKKEAEKAAEYKDMLEQIDAALINATKEIS